MHQPFLMWSFTIWIKNIDLNENNLNWKPTVSNLMPELQTWWEKTILLRENQQPESKTFIVSREQNPTWRWSRGISIRSSCQHLQRELGLYSDHSSQNLLSSPGTTWRVGVPPAPPDTSACPAHLPPPLPHTSARLPLDQLPLEKQTGRRTESLKVY